MLPFAVDPAQVRPGLLGFFVVAALGLATFLLIRSMLKQVRKIHIEEPEEEERRDTGEAPREDPDGRG